MRTYAIVMLWSTLALVTSSAFEVSFAGATDTPEKTVPRVRIQPEPTMGNSRYLLRPRIRR
jgi:hypothetical protein